MDLKKEINRLRKKLRQIKNICLTNAKQWDESQHDPVEEFKLMAEIIEEKEKSFYSLLKLWALRMFTQCTIFI